MKKVVVGTGFDWDSKSGKVGIHALVEHLLQLGCTVDWYIHPVSPLFFAKPTNLKFKFELLKRALQGTVTHKINQSIVRSHGMIAPFHPIPNLPLFDNNLTANNFWKLSSIGLSWRFPRPTSDLLLTDSGGICMFPAYAPKSNLTLHRLNDLVAEFPNTARSIHKTEENVIQNADILLPVSSSLYEQAVKIRGRSEGVYLLPNGVNIDRFLIPRLEPLEFQKIPHPRAIFVGSLAKWVDWRLVVETARQRPDVSFCVIGDGQVSVPQEVSNIYVLGSKSPSDVPAFLQYADVGIIPFLDMPLTRRIEKPLKFYEYLASGLPIVTVPFGGMSMMNPPALLAESPSEFAHAIDVALAYSSEQKDELRRIAGSYSWVHIFHQLDEILSTYSFSFS